MATPVVQSTTSNSTISGETVTVTAPTGIVTGDLLLAAYVSFRLTGSTTPNTPAGWTTVQTQYIGSSKGTLRVMSKVAILADETAPDYTFTATNANYMQAAIMRITGAASGSQITVSEVDFNGSNASTVISHTANSTPAVGESLAVIFSGGWDFSIGAIVTASTYTSTPSATWTERADLGYRDGGSDGSSLAVATAPYTGLTQFTAYGYTLSLVMAEIAGVFLLVNAPQNVSGTNSLLEVQPALFNQNGSSGTAGTNTLLDVSPEIFNQNGNGQRMPVWNNADKPSTDWRNADK